jgi:membrane protein DedA with SNARE-associated domain
VNVAALAGLLALLVGGGVGFPVPEDVTLVGAGVLARTGTIAWWQAVAVGVAGVCTADWMIYLAGRRYGMAVLIHPVVARVVRGEHLATVEDLVRRRGAWAVFAARFVLGTRMATFVSAGAFRMPLAAFAIAEGVGTLLFVSLVVTLGYLFAHQAEHILAGVGRAEHWLVLGGSGLLILALLARTLRARWAAGSPPGPAHPSRRTSSPE